MTVTNVSVWAQDSGTAKALAFHKEVATRCITLDGDDFNPGGLLTGTQPGPVCLQNILVLIDCFHCCKVRQPHRAMQRYIEAVNLFHTHQ